jgi:hypothetical protein
MTTERKMSRREWFRLSTPRTEPSNKGDSTNSSMGETSPALKAIEHPVNHDGMDLSELPPMREALLNEAEVQDLFSDIAAFGSDVLLMQRSARSPRAAASKATTAEQLRAVQDSFLSGAVPRLQIRYHWQQQNWIDTLERREDGFRLIRIAHAVAK